eukprot:jgi/Mesvir1/22658/Mv14092-RA.1
MARGSSLNPRSIAQSRRHSFDALRDLQEDADGGEIASVSPGPAVQFGSVPRRRKGASHEIAEDKASSPLFPSAPAEPEKRATSKKKRKKRCHGVRKCSEACLWWVGALTILYISIMLAMMHPDLSPEMIATRLAGDHVRISDLVRGANLTRKHPVVFVPGIITSGLELWEGKECAKNSFRKHMWGGSIGSFMLKLLVDTNCWKEHIMLDPETGLDPPGIKVRPISGLGAADYFVQNFYVFAPLIEALAAAGHDESSLYMASYDWRLAFPNLELRDRYFSRLANTIEDLKALNGEQPVVVVTHSMGSLVFLYFMKWVEADPKHAFGSLADSSVDPYWSGGGRPLGWVDAHIKSVVNIGPPFLGVAKSIPSLLSGETMDTANMRAATPWFADPVHALTMPLARSLFRSWGSLASMLPKGGEAVWGNSTFAPDDPERSTRVMARAAAAAGDHACAASLRLQEPSSHANGFVAAPCGSASSSDPSQGGTPSGDGAGALGDLAPGTGDGGGPEGSASGRDKGGTTGRQAAGGGSRDPGNEAAGVSGDMAEGGADDKRGSANGSGGDAVGVGAGGSERGSVNTGDGISMRPHTEQAFMERHNTSFGQTLRFHVVYGAPVNFTTLELLECERLAEMLEGADDREQAEHVLAEWSGADPPPNCTALQASLLELHAHSSATSVQANVSAVELSIGRVLSMSQSAYSIKDTIGFLREAAPQYMRAMDQVYSHGISVDLDEARPHTYKYWSNPLETRLPIAPRTRMMCLYGVGLQQHELPTERGYVYSASVVPPPHVTGAHSLYSTLTINTMARDDAASVAAGVVIGEGDGSVPLLSLGFMCSRGWRDTRYNPPGNMAVVNREYLHQPPQSLLEGRGSSSGDHVDIMGNYELLLDVVRVAAGGEYAEGVTDRYYSDIRDIALKVDLERPQKV